MDMQNVKELAITEGNVRTIHDKDGNLLWGRLVYDTKYSGDTIQDGTPTPDAPVDVQVVTGEQTVTINGSKNLFNAEYYKNAEYSTNVYQYTTTNFPGGKTYTFTAELKSGKSAITGLYVFMSTAPNPNSVPISQRMNPISNGNPVTTIVTSNVPEGSTLYFQFYPTTVDVQQIFDTYNFMLEVGDTASPYEPFAGYANYTVNLGSIELCKIGTYQDYIYKSGSDWYVHKAVSKVIIDGTLGTFSAPSANRFNIDGLVTDYRKTYYSNLALSDQYISLEQTGDNASFNTLAASYNYCLNFSLGNNTIRFKNTSISTTADFKTALGTNPVSIYYALATATDTKITDSTLISQLNAVHQFLTRYGYNSSVSGNLPLIINQTNLS